MKDTSKFEYHPVPELAAQHAGCLACGPRSTKLVTYSLHCASIFLEYCSYTSNSSSSVQHFRMSCSVVALSVSLRRESIEQSHHHINWHVTRHPPRRMRAFVVVPARASASSRAFVFFPWLFAPALSDLLSLAFV